MSEFEYVPPQVMAAGKTADDAMRAPQGTPAEAPTQSPTPAPPAAPAVSQPAISTNDSAEIARAEQRYRVLQGKYNTEITALAETVKGLRAEIEGMRQAAQQPPATQFALDDFEAHGPEIQKLAATVKEQA